MFIVALAILFSLVFGLFVVCDCVVPVSDCVFKVCL